MPTDDRINILLVDDQVSNLVTLEATLMDLGQNLVKARSGTEALRCLLNDHFAVILMDVRMPGMDGFETAELIRQREKTQRTPIIFLTAMDASDVNMFRGYSVGAVDYLFKPVVPEILRCKVAAFVDLFKKTEEVRRQADQLREIERREHERKLAEAKERWESERLRLAIALAREIQQKLFPADSPACPGFDIYGASYPASDTGGDYFDYIPMQNNCVGIVIGDVAGHGLGPALLMAATRAYLRALALTHNDVTRILALANRSLAADTAQTHFVTLMLARLDPQTGSFAYCNAGHPSAYVLDASGAVRSALESTTIPLGIDCDANFPPEVQIEIQPGETVLLVTDGIVEASAPNGSQFGVERAIQVVRDNRSGTAREIVQTLANEVRSFTGHDPYGDDVTAIVVKASGAIRTRNTEGRKGDGAGLDNLGHL